MSDKNKSGRRVADEPKKRIDRRTIRRSVVVIFIFAAVAVTVICALFKMQVIKYEDYQQRVLDQLTVETKVNPERGNIYDRNGNILATNVSNYLVILSPQDIIDCVDPAEADEAVATFNWTDKSGKTYNGIKMNELIARELSDLLDVEYDYVMEKAAKKGRRYEEICDGVSEEDADKATCVYLRAQINKPNLSSCIICTILPVF